MKNLKDKVVVVTGVGSGIGRELAIQLKREGAKLAVNEFNFQTLNETVQMLGDKSDSVLTSCFDVSDRNAFYEFADSVIAHFGKVDCIINNAGVALGGVTTEDIDYKDFEWIVGINMWGMIYGTKAFLPIIRKQGEGSIVNVSSVFGLFGVANNTAYCTTKFAIRGFTESLRMEMHAYSPQVIVSSVHPGGIKTNIARSSKTPIGAKEASQDAINNEIEEVEKQFITTSSDAAAIIIKGIKDKKERILIGSDAKKADRLVRLFPVKYTDKMLNQTKADKLGKR